LFKINIAIGSPCRFCCPGEATQSSRILALPDHRPDVCDDAVPEPICAIIWSLMRPN